MSTEKLQRLLLLFLLLLTNALLAQESWIRYNLAGYDPIRPKKAIVMSNSDLTGKDWTLTDSTKQVKASGKIDASVAGKGDYLPKPFNYTIDFSNIQTKGKYTLTVGQLAPVVLSIKDQPYAALLSQILRTIRVRRSGSADALDHAISHLGDSSCSIYKRAIVDANNLGKSNSGSESWKAAAPAKKANMLGGYYDAGDYLKFTLTNAHLTYLLLRSYQTAPELFEGMKLYSTSSLNDLLDNAKWGLDYLVKSMPNSEEFIIQTGGSKDHEQGLRLPENDLLNGKRECYSAFSKPQMGLTAAALALGAQVFAAKGMTQEANAYKEKAILIYSAAKASTALPAWWQTTAAGGEEYYPDRTENDNMELAAIELHLLTNEATYLTDAVTFGKAAGIAYWSSWGVYNTLAHLRVYPKNTSLLPSAREDLNGFKANAALANNLWGIPHESVWGSLYSQISVAYNAIEYKRLTNTTTYQNIGYDVADYVLGRNPWGLGFVASKEIPSSITSSYAVIYRLQPSKFPYGEIAEGPATADDYAGNTQYFDPPHNPTLWHSQFNTSKFTFFEQPGDYISMETTIGGLADGLYFFTLASKFFFDQSLEIEKFHADLRRNDVSIHKAGQEHLLHIHFPITEPFDVLVYDAQGTKVAHYKNQKAESIRIEPHLPIGAYIAVLQSASRKVTCKFLIAE